MEIFVNRIQITPVRAQNGLVAFVECDINDCLHCGSIALYTAPNSSSGYRLVFPTKKITSDHQIPCFYPNTKEAETVITNAIVKKYHAVINKQLESMIYDHAGEF